MRSQIFDVVIILRNTSLVTSLLAGLSAPGVEKLCGFGGLGGSPFIEGSTGNIPTEETVNLLEGLGYNIMIDKKKVSKITRWLYKKIQTSYFGGQIFKKL